MAGNVRTRIGGIGGGRGMSRAVGTPVGVQINTSGLKAMRDTINGPLLVQWLLEAWQPALEQAFNDWPKLTHASSETIRLEIIEEGPNIGRIALMVGGERLILDPRNKSKKDYSPFVEFNGTATAFPGTISGAVFSNMDICLERLKELAAAHLRGLSGQ